MGKYRKFMDKYGSLSLVVALVLQVILGFCLIWNLIPIAPAVGLILIDCAALVLGQYIQLHGKLNE